MTAQQTYEVITLPNGGWATGNWRDNFGGVPKFDVYETDFGTGYTRPSNPPFISDPGPRWGEPGHEPWQRFPGPLTLPLPNPTPRQVDPNEIFNPFGFPGGLAGKYMGMGMNNPPLWAGALGNLIGAGIKLFKRK